MLNQDLKDISAKDFNHNELRGLIKARGYTNEDFAEILGIHPSTLSTVLTGKSVFRSNTILKAAIALGINDPETFHRVFFSLKN